MKISRLTPLVLLGMLFHAQQAQSQQTLLTDDDLRYAYLRQTPARVSVHDPSMFIDSITSSTYTYYYMLGSHLGMARYMVQNATQRMGSMSAVTNVSEASTTFFSGANGQTVHCTQAYGNQAVSRVVNYAGQEVDFPAFDAHAWQKDGANVIGNQWAPDVVYNPTMGKWLMYMSLNSDSWCSSILCFAADKCTGPYRYQGPVVCSGFSGHYAHNGYGAAGDWQHTDLAIATGSTTLPQRYTPYSATDVYYYGKFWPNCIDPCVFYDEEGQLWLSYGSWSSGIWMLPLDETTGLRDYTVQYPYQVKGQTVTPGAPNANCDSDPYFGKKIAGGWYDSGEGSYIEHIGDWYYLFMSYGGFAPDGGYEMRLFRSVRPDGPYVDSRGGSAIQYDRYQMNYGPSAGFNNGVKLMGGYQWCFMPSAEVSQGHNSALTDRQGRSLVCYHTKFNDGTIHHSVRLHQLFQNQDGWLVAAPMEFHNGDTLTQQAIAQRENVPTADIPGTYLLMRHPYKVKYDTMAYQKPVTITLTAGADTPGSGTITGAMLGTWRRITGTDYFELTTGGVTYRGVLCRQTIDYSNVPALAFTVVSTSGGGTLGSNAQLSMWGLKADAKAAIRCALDELTIPVTADMHVTQNLRLPVTTNSQPSRLGAVVSWQSSDPTILTNAGVIRGDGEVTLSLTISKDGYMYNKSYPLRVGDYTPISTIKGEESPEPPTFDLYGRKVQKQPGKIYIINGRRGLLDR